LCRCLVGNLDRVPAILATLAPAAFVTLVDVAVLAGIQVTAIGMLADLIDRRAKP